jgi:AraC-like DNA-binding protein
VSSALAVFHGRFGRVTLYRLNKPMLTHAHREGHLIFHVGGPVSQVEINGTLHPQTPTRAAAINPWEPHAFRPGCSVDGMLCLVLYIDPIWFIGDGARGALRFGRPSIPVEGELAAHVDWVLALLQHGSVPCGLDDAVRNLTEKSFRVSWAGLDSPQPIRVHDTVSDFRVRKATRLITETVGQDIDLDNIARESGLSRPHFYKLFRQHLGITPALYLNTLRMERALSALTTTDRSVTDIGYDLGFSSQSVFTRVFAANVGMAPTDYRRAAQVLAA